MGRHKANPAHGPFASPGRLDRVLDHRIRGVQLRGLEEPRKSGEAARAGLGPVLERVRTRAAAAKHSEKRDVVSARLVIRGKEFRVAVAVTDRKDMRYHMIIAADILRDSGFLIDPREGDPRNGNNGSAGPHR